MLFVLAKEEPSLLVKGWKFVVKAKRKMLAHTFFFLSEEAWVRKEKYLGLRSQSKKKKKCYRYILPLLLSSFARPWPVVALSEGHQGLEDWD